MQGLLVIASLLAAASAQYVGYPYALGHGLTYGLAAPHVYKTVVKEIEIPVPTIEYSVPPTGCTNNFGLAVPCLQAGEARKKRDADEVAVEAAPAAAVLPYGLPFYGGLGYYGLGGLGLGLGGLGYAGYPYALPAAPVVAAEPVVHEVEVLQYKFVPQVTEVELPPLCNNVAGWPVPCA